MLYEEACMNKPTGNPLASAPITGLIMSFAIPSILNTLVNAVYNITDQIFIGNVVGLLGNAATNVAFPIMTLVAAFSLMVGLGGASNFNLSMGAGNKDAAIKFVGSGIGLMTIIGIFLAVVTQIFLKPLLILFGTTPEVMPLAAAYLRITACGIPFLLFATAGSTLIRADGSPTYAMVSLSTGAILNIPFNALFLFVFKWGIAGSAVATVLGQVISFVMTVLYLRKFKAFNLTKEVLLPRLKYIKGIIRLGTAGFLNHFVMMIVQITMNNTLGFYGAQSPYGSDMPLAVVGLITKVNYVVLAFVIGIAQGTQPIFSFNYGAKNFVRVRDAYKKAAVAIVSASVVFFLCFQLFPRQIIGIFGNGSEAYFVFAIRYMRIFMALMFINGIQPLTANFFTVTGKAKQGIFLSLTRQGLFLLPLLIILPLFFGIEGAIYAGPIADLLAVTVSLSFISHEMRKMKRMELEQHTV